MIQIELHDALFFRMRVSHVYSSFVCFVIACYTKATTCLIFLTIFVEFYFYLFTYFYLVCACNLQNYFLCPDFVIAL